MRFSVFFSIFQMKLAVCFFLLYICFLTEASYSIHNDLASAEYCQLCFIKQFDEKAKFSKSPEYCTRLEYEDGIVRKKIESGDAYLITCYVSKAESKKIDPSAAIVVSGVLLLTVSKDEQQKKFSISKYITDRHVSYDDNVILTEEQVLEQVHPKVNREIV